MSVPFIVHSAAGELGTQHDSLEDAKRAQVTLRGPIMQGLQIVVEGLS